VETFQPDPYRAATPPYEGACIPKGWSDPIQVFYDACLGAKAKKDACTAFQRDYPACVACIVTPESAGRYGPIIDHGGYVTGNIPGCIELTDPGGLSCAKSLQALSECEQRACSANCPVTNASTLTAYDNCASEADATGCVTYSDAANCAEALSDAGGDASICLQTDFKGFYDSVVPLFCGTAPPPAMMIEAGSTSALLDATSGG
jgi:hypothetical protein